MEILMTAPNFSPVRSEAGAVTADPAVLNLTNYPAADGFQLGGIPETIQAYWNGTNANELDALDLQVLIYNGKAATPEWVEGEKAVSLRPKKLYTFTVAGASLCYLRVTSVTLNNAVTGLKVWAAKPK